MTHLKLLRFFLSISVGQLFLSLNLFAGTKEMVDSLRGKGMTCRSISLTGCELQECVGKLSSQDISYSKSILFLIPPRPKAVRLHFHGHHLGLAATRTYESGLSQMIQAFKIENKICLNDEVVIIPESTGKNVTYAEHFNAPQKILSFTHNLINILEASSAEKYPLHLSGHSGGGKYVGKALEAGIEAKRVTLFDGVYSEKTSDQLIKWYKRTHGSFNLVTVKNNSPYKFSIQLQNKLNIDTVNGNVEMEGTQYDIYHQGKFTHLTRETGQSGSLKAHFEVVSETWNLYFNLKR